MSKVAEIDLVGELLPVGLLRCKNALENLGSQDILCVCTDDLSLVDHVARFISADRYRLLRGRKQKQDRPYRIHIIKV